MMKKKKPIFASDSLIGSNFVTSGAIDLLDPNSLGKLFDKGSAIEILLLI
jgi:hypothetical protein